MFKAFYDHASWLIDELAWITVFLETDFLKVSKLVRIGCGALVIRIYEASQPDDSWLRQEIFDLIRIADTEFLPPLSSRGKGMPDENLETVLHQEMNRRLLYAVDEENPNNPILAGYMSFEDNHVAEMSNGGQPCRYVIRVIVKPAYRGNGITEAFYEYLVNISSELPGFGVRTWTTNYAHRKILDRCGFIKDGLIKDDRGPAIDTIYYWKQITDL